MCLHNLHFCTTPFLSGRGQGDGPSHVEATLPEAGVQRAQPFGRGLGVSPRVLICSPLPTHPPRPRLPRRFTPRNDRAGGSRRPEGAAPASGESRGVQPHWQAVWRMCLHILHFCTFPLPERKGVGGWSKPSLRQLSPKQASRGRRPLAGVWGCPPECSFAPPFLAGRGPGGWCVPQLYYGLQSNLWYASDLQDGVRPGTAVYR